MNSNRCNHISILTTGTINFDKSLCVFLELKKITCTYRRKRSSLKNARMSTYQPSANRTKYISANARAQLKLIASANK